MADDDCIAAVLAADLEWARTAGAVAWQTLSDERARRIAGAVAVRATRDARLELDELRAEVMRYRAALPAILGALRARLAVSPHGSDAKPYREALAALRGSEGEGG